MVVLVQMPFARLCPSLGQKLYQIGFFVGSQHQVYTVDLAHSFTLQLGVTACHHNKGTGIFPHHPVNGLSAFVVGDLGDRACIDEADVGLVALADRGHSHVAQQFAEC